ncbi:MAG: hypothetical protein J6S51_03920 [Kiritimatiellae bacterium]|nr:hypothetical protein [Kiritimatiellia bacterium]
MNKLMMAVVACAVFACGGAFADENKSENLLEKPTGNPLVEIEQQEKNEAIAPKKNVAMWPACFAVFELPETPDLVGIRFAIPYSTKQESVTGFDIGFWGRSRYFEGVAVNIFRNDVKEKLSGLQVALYNSAGYCNLGGVQIGVWNEVHSINGVQAGLVNIAGDAHGFQIGLINRAETMSGFQFGAINIIRDAEIAFCPFVNIGF